MNILHLKKIIRKKLNEQFDDRRKKIVKGQDSELSLDINPKKLKLGDGGVNKPSQQNDVKILQQNLINKKLLNLPTPTGYFGKETEKALNNYYKNNNPSVQNDFFLDCVTKSPSAKVTTLENGLSAITINNYVFYGNGTVKTPNGDNGKYFCYKNGVKIKITNKNDILLPTGVITKRNDQSDTPIDYTNLDSVFQGFTKFIRTKFPNFAQILLTKPLTGKDFTDSQKKVMFNVIQNSINNRGNDRTQGCVTYIDYGPDIDQQLNRNGGASTKEMLKGTFTSDKFRVATTLGGFCYQLQSNGVYRVTDDYDFHKWKSFTVKPEEVKGMNFLEKIMYIQSKTNLSPYGAIRHVGWLEHPDDAPVATKTKIVVNVDSGYYAKKNNNNSVNV